MTSPAPSYHGYRFPPEIISHAVWLYHRFCLSFRDAEDLAQRGVTLTYETIRQWCQTFGPDCARDIRQEASSMEKKVIRTDKAASGKVPLSQAMALLHEYPVGVGRFGPHFS